MGSNCVAVAVGSTWVAVGGTGVYVEYGVYVGYGVAVGSTGVSVGYGVYVGYGVGVAVELEGEDVDEGSDVLFFM